MKSFLFSFKWAIMLCATNSFCQFSDTTAYHINHASTGSINQTNTGNIYILNNNFKFQLRKKRITLNATSGWIYGKQQRALTNNDFTSAIDFNLFKTQKRFYYWGLLTYDKNYSLKINNRLQTGLGVGYSLVDRTAFLLVLSDGLLYEKGDLFETEQNRREIYDIIRNSFRIKYRIVIKNLVTLDGTDFIQQSLASEKDYILISNTNLSVKIKTWLNLTVALTYNKLNKTGRENLLLNYGLTIDKYF